MRLLPEVQSSEILQATCDYLRTYPFSLPDCTENVRIITGEEEGLYGWIAVNYLMDGFDKHEHAVGGEAKKHSSTYGFLDMGGASTQIAFEPSDREQIAHADNLLEVKLRLLSGKDVRHPVFVTTWLGFGTNQARSRYIDAQIKAHVRESDEAHRPGDTTEVLVDDPCLPKSLMLSETRHSGYTLRGTGDFATCVRRTGPLLNKEVECLDQPCLFNGVHVPPIDFEVNHFIGISEYYYSTQDVWSMGGVYDFVEFERNAIEYCGRQWDDIMEEHKKGGKWKSSVELSRLETQCFKAAWIINILHEGIGIPRIIDNEGEGDGKNLTDKALKKGVDKGLLEPKKPSFQSLNEVGDVAVSWTLGKMVLEVSKGTMAAGGLPPDVDHHSKTRPASLDWSGHIPSWSGDVRSGISALKETDPLPLVGLSVIGAFLFFFFLSSNSARRRQACFGNVFSSASKRRGGDFLPLSQDDAASSSGDSSNGSGSRTPPRGGRRKGSTSNVFARVLSPLRYGLFRVSSTVRTWTRPRANSLLPTSRSTTSLNQNEPDLIRPRPLRPSKSTPFLRSTHPAPTAPHTNPTGGAGHWNDIPDLSEREKGVSLLPRSNSYNVLSTSSAPSTRTVSPPPMSFIPSAPLSRPSSRGAGTPLGLTKLTARTRESSSTTTSLDEPRRSNSSGTGSFFPEPSLSTGVWESLGAGDAIIDGATSPMAMMDSARGAPSPGIMGGESGAKLRASRSQNSSQVNLAASFAARRKEAGASSSSLAGGGGGEED